MTPKEKAQQLVEKFEITAHPFIDVDKQLAKTCALKCVDEMLECSAKLNWNKDILHDPFLIEVKKEIQEVLNGQNIDYSKFPMFHPPT